jgi:hypothetical protein
MFATAQPMDAAEGFFLAPPVGHQDFPLTIRSRILVMAA